jgi:hypothetical protein
MGIGSLPLFFITVNLRSYILQLKVNARGAKFDHFGNKMRWFGYKIHLSVDTESDLSMALTVTPDDGNDGDVGP